MGLFSDNRVVNAARKVFLRSGDSQGKDDKNNLVDKAGESQGQPSNTPISAPPLSKLEAKKLLPVQSDNKLASQDVSKQWYVAKPAKSLPRAMPCLSTMPKSVLVVEKDYTPSNKPTKFYIGLGSPDSIKKTVGLATEMQLPSSEKKSYDNPSCSWTESDMDDDKGVM